MGGSAGKRPRVDTRSGAPDDAGVPPSGRIRLQSWLGGSSRSADDVRGNDSLSVGCGDVDTDDEAHSVGSIFSSAEESSSFSSAEEELLDEGEAFYLGADNTSDFDSPGRQVISSPSSAPELAAAASDASDALRVNKEKLADGNRDMVLYNECLVDEVQVEGSAQLPMKIEMNMAVVDTMSKTKVVNKTWSKRAEDEAKHFLDKVAAIRASIMEGKNAGNQYKYSGQWVVGKLAKFEAAIADRKYFACNEKLLGALSEAERSIVAQAFSLIEQPCFNFESSMQNRRIQAKKLSGIFVESVICNDRFGVPKAALTCNALLDEVNWLLADGYSAITCLLERICLYMVFKVLFEDLCDRMDAEMNDLIAATGVLRTMCRKVRAVVIELGGPPLLEPVAFWKEKYPMVKF